MGNKISYKDWLLPDVAADAAFEAIKDQSRIPFQAALAELMDVKPEADRLRGYFEARPDEWYRAIRTLAMLSGYAEKTESLNVNLEIKQIRDMPDSELYEMIRELTDKTPLAPLLELEPDRERENAPLEEDHHGTRS